MKKEISRIVWGIALMTIGIVLILNTLNILQINLFFEGWWTLFIIIPSLIGLIFDNQKDSSLIFLLLGIGLLLSTRDIIDFSKMFVLLICIILIITGLKIIFKFPKHNHSNTAPYLGIIGGCEEKINVELKDCDAVAVFGGVDLDLRKAKIKKDVVINATSIFGGIDIIVNEETNVITKTANIFGGTDNKTKKIDNVPTITVTGVAIFGGIDIKTKGD